MYISGSNVSRQLNAFSLLSLISVLCEACNFLSTKSFCPNFDRTCEINSVYRFQIFCVKRFSARESTEADPSGRSV
jgi:hypothetical protein